MEQALTHNFFKIPEISKKNRAIVRGLYLGAYPFIHSYFDVEYENLDVLQQLKDEGFLLLPKHQRNLDIALEVCLLQKSIQKPGFYIMKAQLPKWLEKFGGIPVIRGRDIREKTSQISERSKRRAERKSLADEGKRIREESVEISSALVERNEAVVIHPEGTFYYKEPFHVNRPNLERLVRIQKITGKEIPYVPLSIKYHDSKYNLRSKATLSVKEPLKDLNLNFKTLRDYLRENLG